MSADGAAQTLRTLQEKGVAVWLEDGRLRYEASQGALAIQDLLALRAQQDEIAGLLKSAPVPLTFSQQWSWHTLGLASHASSRSVAAALRISGRIDHVFLRQVLSALMVRHAALRTHIVLDQGEPIQVIDEAESVELEALSVASVAPENRMQEAERLAGQWVRQPVNVSCDRLFAACLLQIEADDHILVMAMDHIISDGASLEILVRDFRMLYEQVPVGDLPAIALQFADYAIWLQRSNQAWWRQHERYWRDRLAGAAGIQLFQSANLEASTRMACVSLSVTGVLSNGIRELSRKQQTTLAMSVLTAYVAALMRSSGTRDVVIPFVSASRLHPGIKHTIGYFGAVLYLRIALEPEDCFLDALRRVTQEYASACLHADAGRLAAALPRPVYAANPRFNWIPSQRASAFKVIPRDDFDERGGGPELVMWDTSDGLRGELWYRADLFDRPDVERFERCFQQTLQEMVGAGAHNPVHAGASSRA